jgi:hypothetical protein
MLSIEGYIHQVQYFPGSLIYGGFSRYEYAQTL